jgi:acetoin utilization protein AcuB
MIAKKLIKDVPVVSPTTTGLVAMSLMDELKTTHLAVVEDGACEGLVSETMLFSVSDPEVGLREGGLVFEKFCATEDQHVYEIAQIMIENRLSLLPVVDPQHHYLGCILHTDILEVFGEFASVCEPGGIIVLEIGERDYSLQQIAGIVESNDARILSVQTTPQSDSTRLEVTLKINKMDLRAVLQTFARYNYVVSASFQEAGFGESLRERYDSLMNYLKV